MNSLIKKAVYTKTLFIIHIILPYIIHKYREAKEVSKKNELNTAHANECYQS